MLSILLFNTHIIFETLSFTPVCDFCIVKNSVWEGVGIDHVRPRGRGAKREKLGQL